MKIIQIYFYFDVRGIIIFCLNRGILCITKRKKKENKSGILEIFNNLKVGIEFFWEKRPLTDTLKKIHYESNRKEKEQFFEKKFNVKNRKSHNLYFLLPFFRSVVVRSPSPAAASPPDPRSRSISYFAPPFWIQIWKMSWRTRWENDV